jgi:hypothetical protein
MWVDLRYGEAPMHHLTVVVSSARREPPRGYGT